jgi:hypothetical protein
MTSENNHIGSKFDDFLKEENIKISKEEILNMIRQNHIVEDRIFGCNNKVKFSLNKAKIKAQQYGQSYYKCNHCGYYHLTRQNTYDSIMNQESEVEK